VSAPLLSSSWPTGENLDGVDIEAQLTRQPSGHAPFGDHLLFTTSDKGG
jgi:hypothetical protein